MKQKSQILVPNLAQNSPLDLPLGDDWLTTGCVPSEIQRCTTVSLQGSIMDGVHTDDEQTILGGEMQIMQIHPGPRLMLYPQQDG